VEIHFQKYTDIFRVLNLADFSKYRTVNNILLLSCRVIVGLNASTDSIKKFAESSKSFSNITS